MTTTAPGPAPLPVREAIQAIARQGMPEVAFSFPRTYVVHTVHGDTTLDLIPPPDAPDLPPLSHVAQWGTGGVLVTPYEGAMVAVSFLDANPTRPILLGFAPGAVKQLDIDANLVMNIAASTLVTRIAGGTPIAQGAARLGSVVICGPFGGAVTANCSALVAVGG